MQTVNNEINPDITYQPVSTGTISIFVTNLGKYNEGELIGEWLELPTTKEEFHACLTRIGIDGEYYEEFFLTDYESEITGLSNYINEYNNVNEFNYLAEKLSCLSITEQAQYEAVLEMGEVNSLVDLINLTDSLDNYGYLDNVNTEYDLGYYWVEESGGYDLKSLGALANYIDYERFGHDVALNEGGVFTGNGYLYSQGESLSCHYDGTTPDEYCLL